MNCTVLSLTVVYRTIPTSNHNFPLNVLLISLLYIVLFLHQTTTWHALAYLLHGCISYYSYIKPQLIIAYICLILSCISYYSYIKPQPVRSVAFTMVGCISYYSYIKPQHTVRLLTQMQGCISYYSYIKPQPWWAAISTLSCCISYYSYIKPQLAVCWAGWVDVVYRTIPTSNHNSIIDVKINCIVVYRTIPTSNHNSVIFISFGLKVVYRTIPTSNHNPKSKVNSCLMLYIVLFLHQTTTWWQNWKFCLWLYIVLFLHQTTTLWGGIKCSPCCISYYSYIKPQQQHVEFFFVPVVYRTIPTSNHNCRWILLHLFVLYIVLFLHQTTTSSNNKT